VFRPAPRPAARLAAAALFAVLGLTAFHTAQGQLHSDDADPIVNCGVQCIDGGSSTPQGAEGSQHGSPGVLSGDVVTPPIHVPVNDCTDGSPAAPRLNPAVGSGCATP
jgi:hypothetical protein